MEAARRAGSNEASPAEQYENCGQGQHQRIERTDTKQERAQQPGSRSHAQQSDRAPEHSHFRRGCKEEAQNAARCDPKAMRMAISCARRAAEKEMTLYMPSAASSAAAMARQR